MTTIISDTLVKAYKSLTLRGVSNLYIIGHIIFCCWTSKEGGRSQDGTKKFTIRTIRVNNSP